MAADWDTLDEVTMALLKRTSFTEHGFTRSRTGHRWEVITPASVSSWRRPTPERRPGARRHGSGRRPTPAAPGRGRALTRLGGDPLLLRSGRLYHGRIESRVSYCREALGAGETVRAFALPVPESAVSAV
jgi:hypothetical protein